MTRRDAVISRRLPAIILIAGLLAVASRPAAGDSLEDRFLHPPAEARPWVYWFWSNANVTKAGITADLEAMQRVGIGGALIMDVAVGFAPPRGTAEFMNPEWRELFGFALAEARRLGLEINMSNGPGWCGSSGPWITPELSMQMLVATNLVLAGPGSFSAALPRPPLPSHVHSGPPDNRFPEGRYGVVKYEDFYRDVAVLAYPETNGVVPPEAVLDLTSKLDPAGHLNWEVPPGRWTVQRIGHTTTGWTTSPPVAGGNGLECDKLSREAADAQFAGMMRRLIDDVGKRDRRALTGLHIDSWEVGCQNWTPRFREEFLKRRGYDPIRFLPNILDSSVIETANTRAIKRDSDLIGGPLLAGRFRWDFEQTLAELLAENYPGRLAELARQNGLRLTVEGYELPFGDEATYAARADEPMSEFWTGGAASQLTHRKGRQIASVGHIFGRTIIGAEAFTSTGEKWTLYPALLKSLGDFEFCQGINRFVIHRYAHQPYLDRAPGATMGPWGVHYERTQTWWEMSGPWHQYLARCQYLLRQGRFVADLLYLRPEEPHQTYFDPSPLPPDGYRYDEISAEALEARVVVNDGNLVLPDGMSYRALVLPPRTTMTPALTQKLKSLVAAGATVIGPPPKASPSLQDFPQCDAVVLRLGEEVWGDCDGKAVTSHSFGKGRIILGRPLQAVLSDLRVAPDLQSQPALTWIHRTLDDAEVYFLANPSSKSIQPTCSFRSTTSPEIWNPETGEMCAIDHFTSQTNTSLTLPLAGYDSVFVVFRKTRRALPTFAPDGLKPLLTVNGPWSVDFPRRHGGPERLILPHLVSWTESTNEHVKFFSGIATYRTSIAVEDATQLPAGCRIFLELGKVEVMARVKLNGQDCGIAWRNPFRVEVTRALRAGANTLEVEVANLWPNRMIGDAALPESLRSTWSSWQPFTNTAPLLKSGLFGPVRIVMVR